MYKVLRVAKMIRIMRYTSLYKAAKKHQKESSKDSNANRGIMLKRIEIESKILKSKYKREEPKEKFNSDSNLRVVAETPRELISSMISHLSKEEKPILDIDRRKSIQPSCFLI
jgi:tRNA G10  N-methylase Trm11